MKRAHTPSLLLTGATGQIGYGVLQTCAARGIRVLAVSRRPHSGRGSEMPGGSWVQWLQQDLALSPDPGRGPRRLLHAAPLGLAPDLVASLPGLERAVAFSSTSALVKHDSPDPGERAAVAQLLEGEKRFALSCEKRGVAWTLLRPTLIYGYGLDRNLSRVARWARRWSVFPLPRGRSGLRQPVHAADLAAAALAALERPGFGGRTYALAGGTTLSYREMVERVYRSVGRSPRFVHLPSWLLTALVRSLAGGDVPWAMVGRMGQDLVFDDGPARADLGYAPRAFEPDAATWQPPAGAAGTQIASQSAINTGPGRPGGL